ncbi:hypothetical protein BGLA2_420118 [Burkholderia gladioli]|nr:hypothetical protein BGLA2_420118 [Burkholderia gladioli]
MLTMQCDRFPDSNIYLECVVNVSILPISRFDMQVWIQTGSANQSIHQPIVWNTFSPHKIKKAN